MRRIERCSGRPTKWSHLTQMIGVGVVLAGVTGTARADVRITLRPDMVVNESGLGDAKLLVDEQDAVGEPGSGKGLRPERPFFPGWTAWQYPVNVVIDLGISRHLTRLFLYNESGENPLTIATGTPLAWKSHEIVLNGYRNWREFPLNTETRYLRLTLAHPSSLPEIALYGDGQAPAMGKPPHIARTAPLPTMDQFIGTNIFIDDPIDLVARPIGFAREYHNWSWDLEGADHKVRFQPSGAAGGHSWFFDDFYARLKAMGVTVSPAVQNNATAYFPGSEGEAKPITAGADPELPASYAIHAEHLFQYAARYGSAVVPAAKLRLAEDQSRVAGLGSLKYIENWNEPDKTWRGRAGRFTPYELAAMCSADRDGDQGRMSKSVGVRSADPKMRLVIGGLAGLSLDYLRAMKFWADVHRGGDFPADVINLHYYSSDGDSQQAFKTTGISPEADHVREKLSEIVAWRNAYLPDREVWVTEFGYDTNQKSPLHAPPIGVYSAEEVQAIWLIRSYLALAAAGVDKAAMFMFRDVKSDGGGVFETCGMVTEKGQWKPKPSYFYIATLKKRLAGMRFAGEVASSDKSVLVYHFVNSSGNSAYLVWSPTAIDRKVPRVSFPVNGKSAEVVEFTAGSMEGKEAPLKLQQRTITLEVREKPVLILAH